MLDQVPEHGNSYEAGQPPIYYAVTAVLSKIAPGDDIDSLRVGRGLAWAAQSALPGVAEAASSLILCARREPGAGAHAAHLVRSIGGQQRHRGLDVRRLALWASSG